MRLERYPGVDVETMPRSDGMGVKATYVAHGFGLLPLAEVERAQAGSGRRDVGYMLDRLCNMVAMTAMRQAAVAVLRLVRPDWRGLWGIRMRVETFENGPGTLTRVNYSERWMDIAWDRGDTTQVKMADAIELLMRGEWKLP